MEQTVIDIQRRFPALCQAARDLVLVEAKLNNYLKTKYGENTIEYLLAWHDYNVFLSEVESNGRIPEENRLAKFAVERNKIFKNYLKESCEYYKVVGVSQALKDLDTLNLYYKSVSHILGF